MNEQEKFWATSFGNEYIERNSYAELLSSNINIFSDVLSRISNVKTILEIGANIGLNLEAIKSLIPNSHCDAVEINEKACEILGKKNLCNSIYNQSINSFKPEKKYDLTFSKTVLIHLNENDLKSAYEILYEGSKKYVLIAEYYNPNRISLDYRGNSNKLFKADFCGEMLDRYKDLTLIDYKFIYKRDKASVDDITWFLLEKSQ